MSEENVEVIRKLNEIWSADPSNPPYEYMDPKIEWETRWPGLPHYFHGHEGVREWVDRVLDPMEIEMHLIEARPLDEETVLAEYRAHGEGRGSGAESEMTIFDLYSVREGRIYRRRTFYSEAEALEAAGLSE
jgi:ketosteroid isomerase-like protein